MEAIIQQDFFFFCFTKEIHLFSDTTTSPFKCVFYVLIKTPFLFKPFSRSHLDLSLIILMCLCFPVATMLPSERELPGPGGSPLHPSALCSWLQPGGRCGVLASPWRGRPCQRQRVSVSKLACSSPRQSFSTMILYGFFLCSLVAWFPSITPAPTVTMRWPSCWSDMEPPSTWQTFGSSLHFMKLQPKENTRSASCFSK